MALLSSLGSSLLQERGVKDNWSKRKGEGLILKRGDPFPAGAIPDEWQKQSSVDEFKLSEADKKDLAEHGYRYFKTKVTFTIKEGETPPTNRRR